MIACDDLSIVLHYLAEGLLLVWGGDAPPRVNAPNQERQQGLYRLGLDMLASHLVLSGHTVPVTWHDWSALFSKPMQSWWPAADVPEGADALIPLLIEDRPAEWLVDYLTSRGQSPHGSYANTSLWYYHAELQEREMISLMEWCQQNQPDAYALVRAFLIEHPVTTQAELREFLFGHLATMSMPPKLLFDFFEDTPVTCLHKGEYWRCPYCKGLLRWFWGKPRCVRHSVCARLSDGYKGRKPIPRGEATLRLKTGIHWRVCVPGIPELELYSCLKELESNGLLQSVELWPGVDQYDLRLVFNSGEAWAVDVKDIASPHHLRRQLDGERPFLNVGDLSWDCGFFVVPQYRRAWIPDYVERATPAEFWAEVQGMDDFLAVLDTALDNRGARLDEANAV